MQATYSPEDNKLRLYASARLDPETYQRVKDAGFKWAPKQGIFVAPMWTPSRADLLIELAGEIGDEDKSLVERAEDRAERFTDYSDSRREDAEQARAAVAAIADNIPLGQPILVGHHSEHHARKDAERIQNGMRKAVKMWETSEYWQQRAAGALRHAKYLERPDVRARRIKKIEAEKRKRERIRSESQNFIALWTKAPLDLERAHAIAGADHISKEFPLTEWPRPEGASRYEGMMSLWGALGDGGESPGFITPEQARDIAVRVHARTIARADRWIEHYKNRLVYECAMLAEAGGTVAGQKGPEKGGACQCWVSARGGWSYIQKVNKVSVTVLDNWGNGGPNFTRTVPFDKLTGIMTAAEVEQARNDGRLIEAQDKTGFGLLESAQVPRVAPAHPESEAAKDFQAMRETLRAGVQVVVAPQLFPTPPELAARMVELAAMEPWQRMLEPSAGTGNILRAVPASVDKVAVEINSALFRQLMNGGGSGLWVIEGDFLQQNGNLGKFDRIVMNPPFENGADIKHIQHALGFLKPGGRLVAICANGPRQQEQLKPLADTWEDLPADTFKDQGTNVRTALLTITV